MAGGFGGNDEDFNQYEQDEELDEDEEELEENEDAEETYETSQDDNGMLKPVTTYQEKEKKLEKSIEEIKNTLDGKNPKDVRMIPYLKEKEKNTLREAEKYSKLTGKVSEVFKKLGAKIWEFIRNHSTTILVVLGIFLAIFVALPVIISLIVWPIKWLLWPDDDSDYGDGGSNGGMSTSFGVNGKDFYGVRTIYTDDEKARIGLLEEYSTIIDNSIEQSLTIEKLKTITTGSGNDEVSKTYKISVVIDLNIPKTEIEGEEPTDFDFSTFEEDGFKSSYADYYTILNAVAEKVFVYDNPTGVVPETIVEKLNNIKYFGLDATVSAEVKTVIFNKLVELYQVEVFNQTDNKVEEGAIVSQLKTELKSEIESDINTKVTEVLIPYTARAEKLFIKDFTFEKEDDMMSGIPEENYVCWIFMPKTSVEFEKFSFFVHHSDFDNFDIKIFNNSKEISLSKEDFDFSDVGESGDSNSNGENNSEQSNKKLYSYIVKNLEEYAPIFDAIDTVNDTALSDGVSLAEIVSNANITESVYLELNVDGVYTFKNSGVRVEFKSEIEFGCAEIETLWSVRSN